MIKKSNLKKSSTTYFEIATDGAITKKTNSAGVGVVFRYIENNTVRAEAQYMENISYEGVTSQVAELTAIVRASMFIEDFIDYVNEEFGLVYDYTSLNINLYSDSAYCLNCFKGVNGSKPWFLKWMNNGWKNNAKEDISNKDLWVALLSNVNNTFLTCMANKLDRSKVDDLSKEIIESSKNTDLFFNFIKVKGHSGHVLNEIADELAVAAKQFDEKNSVEFIVV